MRLAFGVVVLGVVVLGFAVLVFAALDLVAFDFTALRVLARGFAVRRAGFLTDFLDFTARRRAAALFAAFAFAGRVFRCLGLDRLFFPDFLAMLPPVRLN